MIADKDEASAFPLGPDIQVTIHFPYTIEHDPVKIRFVLLLPGVSVKVTFSPSMSQGLNLIKYW